jgi:phosphoglycolate phosphatase
MTLPFDACLLDLDGTLVDTLGDFVAVLNLTLSDLGLPPVSARFVAHTIGQGSEHLIRATLAAVGGSGAPAALFAPAWAGYQQHYARLNGQRATVYPGVAEGLAGLRALGLPLAVVTNKPAAPAAELLRRLGLAGHFAHVFGGDSFERKKPDPLPLLKACEALGHPPGRVCMVGDSRNDAAAARAAGCPLVLMTYGYNHGEDIRAVPARAHLGRLDEIFSAGCWSS